MVASGPPSHNFVSALLLAEGWRSRLVLDYRDEWTQCPFSFVRLGNVDRPWEERCVRKADAVVFATESFRTHCLGAFPVLRADKCYVIANGWDPDDLSADPTTAPRGAGHGPITLAFLGNLEDHTQPKAFLSAIERLIERRPEWRDGLRIRLVGERSRLAAKQLSDFREQQMLSMEGWVPKPEALRIMREVDGLLVINPPALHRYLPGKLFDYFATGTPLLVFGEGGEVDRVVRELKAGVIVPDQNITALDAALETLARGTARASDVEARAGWLQTHTRQYLAREMLLLFSRTMALGPAQYVASTRLFRSSEQRLLPVGRSLKYPERCVRIGLH